MVAPTSPDRVREYLEFFYQFGYYYARKSAEAEGEAARPHLPAPAAIIARQNDIYGKIIF
jgi:hypothetical protein